MNQPKFMHADVRAVGENRPDRPYSYPPIQGATQEKICPPCSPCNPLFHSLVGKKTPCTERILFFYWRNDGNAEFISSVRT